MKQKLLIIEPSEVIVDGLKVALESQSRFKLLEPETDTDNLEQRLVAGMPDVVLVNATLISAGSIKSQSWHWSISMLSVRCSRPAMAWWTSVTGGP